MEPKSAMELIQGRPMQLGRRVLICPALNLKGMRVYKEELNFIERGVPEEKRGDREEQYKFLSTLATVALAALQRNYPDITLEEVEDGIDFNNVREITQAVMGASGYLTTSEEDGHVRLFGDKGTVPVGERTGTTS
jgi:hypothetical protein